MICPKDKCTGCHACYNICPKKAIDMVEDECGYIYPIINPNCIDCGLCKKVCPNFKEKSFENPKRCYAMHALDKDIHKSSTSGGAATLFSKYIIENGGVVYGAAYSNDMSLHHIRVNKVENLKKLQGSKYVHSYIDDKYKMALEDLKNNLLVLFIGTPCQIDGLKSFLKKDYANLLTIDLICHGVPGQKLLRDEIGLHTDIDKVSHISFRDKDGRNFKVFDINNKEIFNAANNDNYYYFAFLHGLIFRENCFSCPYAKMERVSDITIGDFWGLGKQKQFNHSKSDGISVLLVNNDKGQKMVNDCNELMFFEEREVLEAVEGNSNLQKVSPRHKKRDKFLKEYPIYGYKVAIKSSLGFTLLKEKEKEKVKLIIKKNKLLLYIIKKIKHK